MRTISLEEYQDRIKDAEVLSMDSYGDKVLRTPRGTIVKLFRLKRRLSTAVFLPYVTRFERAVLRLHQLGIPTVEILDIFRIEGTNLDAVVYIPLLGETLREVVGRTKDSDPLLDQFAGFMRSLHDKGIHFRAIHSGNVVVTPTDEFGLIDVSTLSCKDRTLSIARRAHNFKSFLNSGYDMPTMTAYGLRRFAICYLDGGDFNAAERKRFLQILERMHPGFSEST